MRTLSSCVVALLILGSILCVNHATGAPTQKSTQNYVAAYYFHGNYRCSNCYRIEQYSKEAIEQYFKNELDSGKLVFKIINIEEKGNEHFIKDYQLYTKSLIVSLVKNGKEVEFDNLVKVWEFLGNKQKFYDYVKGEVALYLKELE